MKFKHTHGPWSQGITLETEQTRRWTSEQIEENDRRERRMVFANFSPLDEGRSRIRIAICEREEDARRIVACVNACEGLTTDFLETPDLAFAPAHTAAKMAEIEQQRDQMLAALKLFVQYEEEMDNDDHIAAMLTYAELQGTTRSLISKVTGVTNE